MESIVVGEFKTTGINEVNVNLVASKWNHLWWITEWKTDTDWSFRLIKYLRKDSPITTTKLTISRKQAMELVDKVGLNREQSGFRSGFSWRRESDTIMLNEWRMKKYANK